jgi:hypothetical protein
MEQQRLNTEWEATNEPPMTEAEYFASILPLLAEAGVKEISEVMGVSRGYAAQVKMGHRVPHPRHWKALIGLGEESAEPGNRGKPLQPTA